MTIEEQAVNGNISFELLKSVITWLLVVVGWLVVSDQQAARELSKNCYARLQSLREELRKIEGSAVEFHASVFDQAKVREIVRLISELATEISHLRKANSLSPDLSYKVYVFRKSVTFQNFDASVHAPQPLTSPVIDGIAVAKDLLDRALLDASHDVTTRQPSLFRSVVGSVRRLF